MVMSELPARLPVRLLVLLRGVRLAQHAEGRSRRHGAQVHGADEDPVGQGVRREVDSRVGVRDPEHLPEPRGGGALGAGHGDSASRGGRLPEARPARAARASSGDILCERAGRLNPTRRTSSRTRWCASTRAS